MDMIATTFDTAPKLSDASAQRRQHLLRFRHRQSFRLVPYVAGHPVGKGGLASAMSAGSRVLVPDLGEAPLLEPRREPDERRPQPPVDVRDFSVDQLADQDLVALADCLR